MTEETPPGFLANYKIVRPGPARLGQARNLKNRPRPGPARIRPGPVDTSSINHVFIVEMLKPLNFSARPARSSFSRPGPARNTIFNLGPFGAPPKSVKFALN